MITLYNKKGDIIKEKYFTFPGGEEHVQIDIDDLSNAASPFGTTAIHIEADLNASSEIMRLMLTVDAIRREISYVKLFSTVTSFPYARQDRVCNDGEALSLKVMCDLINGMGFEKVKTFDLHSDVAKALINGLHHIPQVGASLLFWLV